MIPDPVPASASPALVPPAHPAMTDVLVGRVRRLTADTSFEMRATDIASLDDARPHIRDGATVAIPWLGRESDEDRIAAARAVRDKELIALPHIASRKLASADHAERLLKRLRDEAGVGQVLLIGGDTMRSEGPYDSALDLLSRTVRSLAGIDRIAFAAYPEAHPFIAPDVLEKALDAKLAVAADTGIETLVFTQFVFTTTPLLSWLAAFRARWSDVPVRIGLAGPASIHTLLRYARRCGVTASSRSLISNGASIARLLAEAGPDPVIRALAAAGACDRFGPVALHLSSFGGLSRSARWIEPIAQGRLRLRVSEAGFRPELR